jgi:hypothetical protein
MVVCGFALASLLAWRERGALSEGVVCLRAARETWQGMLLLRHSLWSQAHPHDINVLPLTVSA